MPTYEYRCENGHTFEVMQRMSDGPVEACTVCGAPVQRVFHPIAVHFKGSGFYNTDYGTRKRSREQKETADADKKTKDGAKAKSASESSSSGGSDSGSGSKSSSDSGSKPKKSESAASSAPTSS